MTIQTNSSLMVASRDSQNSATNDAATANAQARNISNVSAEDLRRFNQALGSPAAKDSCSLQLNEQAKSQAPSSNANNSYSSQSELSAIFSSFMSHNSNSTTKANLSGQITHFDQNFNSDSISNDHASLQATSFTSPNATFTAPNTALKEVTSNIGNTGTPSTYNTKADNSIQNLINHMVDRILVSDPKFSQGSEVRLLLGANTGSLQGSEIILHRNLEGMLAVEINCHNQNQFKKFVEIRNDLKTALEQHEDKECHLLINRPTL